MFNRLEKNLRKNLGGGAATTPALPPPPVRPRVYTQFVKSIFKSLINSKLKLSSGASDGGGGESVPFTPTPPPYGPAGSVADDIRVFSNMCGIDSVANYYLRTSLKSL